MIEQLVTYPIGSRVRVAHGQLAGLTGVVVKVTEDDFNCVLLIDGWVNGACLAVSGTALEWKEKTNSEMDREPTRATLE
jgi:hypothetical protein